ncbi:MAG: hypothetical protein JOZ46_07260 [Candidatus Dormibacteraeota bacterium]|nr:hypothetical protein [Candidatus Dormibacteraeota bacterium]MBV9525595.1 hypothetical protein [Candidatus Dormibacteraeota bacterium]
MTRRLGIAALLLAVAGLTLLWRATPKGAPPVYDGICTPTPYHTVGSSPAPLAGSKSYPASPAGSFPTAEVVTDPSFQTENPSQGQLLMTDGTFVSSEPFTVSITPVQAPGVAPRDGRVDGNVYRVAAVTQSGKQLQPVDAQHQVTLLLRATSMNPARTLERFDGTAWTDLKTLLAGCGDLFEANTAQLGLFAAVVPANAPSGSGGGPPVVPIVIALIVVVLATVIGLVRLNRARG